MNTRTVLLLALCGAGGCFATPPTHENYYSFSGPSVHTRTGRGPRLSIGEFIAAAGYDSTKIAYRLSAYEQRYYAHHQWVADPHRMVADMTERHLRASGRFAEVGHGERVKDADLVLDGRLIALEEIDEPSRWNARLAMIFTVRRPESDRVLLRHAFDVTRPCARRHPSEVARVASKILDEEVDKLGRAIAQARLASRR